MVINSNLIILLIAILSLILGVFCLIRLLALEKMRSSFFAGSNGKDLEAVIRQMADNQNAMTGELDSINKTIADIEHRLSFTTQKIGLVRFNPFQDGGGNFSFCVALLDNHNNGAVITSMHGREQNRIYAKKISAGRAESTLTEEEISAIEEAVLQHNKKIKPVK